MNIGYSGDKMGKKKKKKVKRRNHLAVCAKIRTGAGAHGRGRPDKEASKTACRGRVNVNDYME